MKNNTAQATAVATEAPVHFMKKQRTLISSKLVDLDNLTAFEAGAMSLALVLAVIIGVVQGTLIS